MSPLGYWIGAAWSKSGDFDDFTEWLAAAHFKRQQLAMPLKIMVK